MYIKATILWQLCVHLYRTWISIPTNTKNKNMKTILNLTNRGTPKRNEIPYHISPFPDGQQDVKLLAEPGEGTLEIWSRMNSWKDIELILAAMSAIGRMCPQPVCLYVPYLLGARSDRDFSKGKGGSSYLVDVIAPVLKIHNFQHIKVLDVHNPSV